MKKFLPYSFISALIFTSVSVSVVQVKKGVEIQQQARGADDVLKLMYRSASVPLRLEIDKSALANIADGSKLEELFKKYNLGTTDVLGHKKNWTARDWDRLLTKLRSKSSPKEEEEEETEEELYQNIYPEELPVLLKKVKSTLISFLPSHQINEKDFVVKVNNPLGRLFTYAKLDQVIKEKKLSHIHLPRKFLMIKDKNTNTYITDIHKASSIIEETMHPYGDSLLRLKLEFDSDRYELHIFAEKKVNAAAPLNDNAYRELEELVKEAPFDVGYDNIFTDALGDAVIIDTEYKGESAESALPKISRYRTKYKAPITSVAK